MVVDEVEDLLFSGGRTVEGLFAYHGKNGDDLLVSDRVKAGVIGVRRIRLLVVPRFSPFVG